MTVECPVCREPLTGRPERCFRCETLLAPWWEFEGMLAQPAVVPPPATKRRSAALLVAGIAVGMALGLTAGLELSGRETPARDVPATVVPKAPASSPSEIPARAAQTGGKAARRMTYRVQRGDSLWRIAAAVTGDGRRWRELWPDRAHGRVARNEVLVISNLPEQE